MFGKLLHKIQIVMVLEKDELTTFKSSIIYNRKIQTMLWLKQVSLKTK